MRYRHLILVVALGVALAGFSTPGRAQEPDEPDEFTTEFRLDECKFSANGRNPYFSLVSGDWLRLAGVEDDETVEVLITVLDEYQWIEFETEDGETLAVRTRVIEEREWVDDEIVEISRNFFVRCRQSNDIYYLGEDVDIFEDGDLVSHDGAWRAGMDGALPGLIMPYGYRLGARYFQEIAPGVALDRAEHVDMGLEMDVPAGMFDDCVEVEETTPLDPEEESTKIYCPDVGLVFDDDLELIDFCIKASDLDDENCRDDDDDDDDEFRHSLRARWREGWRH